MARLKTTKSIDDKILECEEKLRKLKERCDRLTDELDGLYAEKKGIAQLSADNGQEHELNETD